MGYPTKSSRFAIQFTDLADVFDADPKKTVVVKCKTRRAANKLRLQFYAFRNAARKENLMVTNDNSNLETLETVEVLIDSDTNEVTFQCKDYSDMAEALNQGLRDAGVTPSTDPLPIKKTR